jgi:hypothetical protein
MESMPSTRRARQEASLWQAVDQRDLTLDVPVQSRRKPKGRLEVLFGTIHHSLRLEMVVAAA